MRLALGLLLSCLVAPAFAQVGPLITQRLFFDEASGDHQGNYVDLESGVIYSDNVDLVRGGPGDTLAMLGLNSDFVSTGPRLDYRLDSDIEWVKYLHSEFESQPYGYVDGSAALTLLPGFAWTLRETYDNFTLLADLPPTPDNLEAINYITTGPRFTLQPTLRTSVVVDATYSYVDSSSKSPLYVNVDDNRYEGDLTVKQAISGVLSAYLTGSAFKVRFRDTLDNPDYTQYQGLGGFTFNDARTNGDVSAGYAKVHENPLTGGTATTSSTPANLKPGGGMWRLLLSRLISPRQRVSFNALRQVTDSASLFRLDIDQPVPPALGNQILNSQPFTFTTYGASWRLQGNRSWLELDAQDVKVTHAAAQSDLEGKFASAMLGRRLNPALSWDLGATYEHYDYEVVLPHNALYAVTTLRWRVGQRLALRFLYGRSTLSPNGYAENQVGITASYALVPGVSPESAPALRPYSPLSGEQPVIR